MTSIAGVVTGLALLVGGAVMHDENYAKDDPRLRRMKIHEQKEHVGYLLGAAGGAVFSLSLQEILDRRTEITLGPTLVRTTLGSGLVWIGLLTHEDPHRGDRDTRMAHETQKTNDLQEHFGYLLGPLGAAAVALSVKGYQNHRSRSKALVDTPSVSIPPSLLPSIKRTPQRFGETPVALSASAPARFPPDLGSDHRRRRPRSHRDQIYPIELLDEDHRRPDRRQRNWLGVLGEPRLTHPSSFRTITISVGQPLQLAAKRHHAHLPSLTLLTTLAPLLGLNEPRTRFHPRRHIGGPVPLPHLRAARLEDLDRIGPDRRQPYAGRRRSARRHPRRRALADDPGRFRYCIRGGHRLTIQSTTCHRVPRRIGARLACSATGGRPGEAAPSGRHGALR